MSTSPTTQFVLAVLDTAVRVRRPSGVGSHSDKGYQHLSVAFVQRCIDASGGSSKGPVGVARSFLSTLETEVARDRPVDSRSQVRSEMFSFIEGWYDARRRHSTLGYKSPGEFEALALEAAEVPSP